VQNSGGGFDVRGTNVTVQMGDSSSVANNSAVRLPAAMRNVTRRTSPLLACGPYLRLVWPIFT